MDVGVGGRARPASACRCVLAGVGGGSRGGRPRARRDRDEPLAERAVTTLSGGERARVALARALATQAPVLLADEPTMSLDPRHQLVVMELLARVAHDGGAVLAIMHDLALAARFADRVLVMDHGRLVADGAPRTVLTPAQIAAVFGVEAVIADTDVGQVPLLRRPI